jgi:hypothetical protein
MFRNSGIALLSTMLIVAGFAGAQAGKKQAQTTTPAPVRDIKVTYGPLVNVIGDTRAVISWSTNITTDTVLKYGTRANQLDQMARSPWSGTTHRVELANLVPSTTYYYRVAVSNAQVTEPMNSPAKFTTKAGGEPIVRP